MSFFLGESAIMTSLKASLRTLCLMAAAESRADSAIRIYPRQRHDF